MTIAREHSTADISAIILDISETGALLKCGRSTVYQLLDAGELTGIKIGRRRLVTYESVIAFVRRQAAA